MIPTNATLIRKAYEDFAKGDVPATLKAFDASIAWHVSGHSPLSGDYKGHDEVVGFFKRTMELSGGVFSPEVHIWRLANGKATEFREFQGDEQTEDRFWS